MSSGPCVVLTREPEDNLQLARALAARGVPVRELPCVLTRYVLPSELPADVEAIAFASRRAVRGFLAAELAAGLLNSDPRPVVAAVGDATLAELRAHGIPVDLVASPPTGRTLAAQLHARVADGAAVLVPRGSLSGGGLEAGFRDLGRAFVPVVVYHNEAPAPTPIAPFPVAAVFVASPSAVARLLARAPWLRERPFLAIGPTTAAALVDHGVTRVLGPAMTLDEQVEILARLA